MRVNVNAIIVKDEKLLLIKFNDESGIHYNLPGGGIDEGEAAAEALERECREEANADVEVQELVGSWEYVPEKMNFKYGKLQKIGLLFLCKLKPGSVPEMPAKPDPNQVGVEWMPIADLGNLPEARKHPILPQIDNFLLEAIRGKHKAFFVSDI